MLVLNNADVMFAVPIGNLGITCIKDAGRRPLSGRQAGLTDLIHDGSGHGVKPAELDDHDGFIIGFGRFTSYGSGRVSCLDSKPGAVLLGKQFRQKSKRDERKQKVNNAQDVKSRVGVVGVGLMGHGIARNIQRAGWPIAFLSHPGNQPVDDLASNGAVSFDTGSDLAASCNTLIICVTGTPQVEDVLFRSDGILNGLRSGGVIIDCSTAIPESTKKIAPAVTAAGGHFLDAPMARTPKEAAEGRLNLIVGGDRDLFETLLPLMRSYAENVTYAGAVGAGHTLKLLHNFVSLGFSAVLAEAAACSAKAGVDPVILAEALGSGGGAGVVFERLKPFILAQDASGFRFSLANARKDIGYYVEMSRNVAAENSAATAIFQMYDQACSAGHEQEAVPELISVFSEKK